MNRRDIILQLQEIFNDVFLASVTISPEMNFRKLPEWDWVTHAYFVIKVQKVFGIDFHVGQEEATQNIGEFADLILKLKQFNRQ